MKKLLKITALCLGLLLFLLALLVFLIPYLVNLETIKQRLAQELSKKLNAQVELKEVDLSLLPQPGLRVRDLDLKSERYHFHLRQGVLVLALRPLLSRHIVVKKLVLTGPELSLFASAAKKAPGEKKPPSGDTLEEIKKRLARVPPFSFEVEQGKLTYFRREKALFSFSDIDGTFAFKPSFWEWELTARSPAAKWIKSSGRLWLEERLGEGLLAVKHLDLARIVPLAERYPRAPLKSDLNLELSYRFEEGTLLLGFTATAPCLLKGKDKDHLFECSAILGQARFKPPYFRIELKEWVMKDPLIKTKGLILRDEQGYQMDFDVAEGDWADVRKRLLAFLGDKAGVRRLCEIIEKGRVSEFRLKAKAPRAKELFRLENLRLSGKAREVELKIPNPELHLTQVSGEMKLSGGLLEVEKAAARFKKTTLSAGSFKIHLRHLKDGTSPLLLRGRVKGVAEDVLLILERVSLPPSLRERLLRLKARGPLEGSVDLRGNLKKLSVAFEVAPRGVFLRYEGFPLPLTLLGGKILYRDRSLSLVGLHVATPRSILRSVNAKLDLGAKPPFLSLTEARGKISVPELTNFLLSFPSIAARLKGYDFRGQEAELLEASYNGPLNPKEVLDHLRFRLKTQALKVRLPVLPDVLDVKQGTVTYEDFALVIEPSQVALLDAEGLLNGKVTFRPFSLSLEGRASCGDGFLSWLFSRSRLPKDYFPTLPLEADPFSFRLKDGEIFFEGDLLCRGAPLHLKVEKDPKVLSLFLSSDELPLKLSLKKTKEVADFSFSGHIDDRGIRRYLRKNPFLIQEIEGDFRAHYVASDVLKSWFVGQVRLSRFRLPSKKYPFWIEALDLKAEKKRLFVRHLEMDLYGTSFEASGRVEISPRFLNVDGSVYTPTLLVEDLLNTLKKEQKKAGKSKEASSKLKIVAHLLVSAESIIYRNYELSPFSGELFYHPGDFKLVVRETYLCGVKLWGHYAQNEEKALQLSFDQPQGDLKETFMCFFGSDLVEGPYELKGYLRTQGKRLFEKTTGRYLFHSSEGHIYKFGALAKVFALLSPLDIFQGNLPDFEKKGTDYNLWEVKGSFKKHYLVIESWRLEAPGFRIFASGKIDLLKGKIDVTVLVSPFKAIDSLVGHVPLIGWILTGKSKTFLAVPVKVRGDLKDPSVFPLDPTTVGAGVLGIIKRTFQLPVKIFVPDKEKPLVLPPPEGEKEK